MAINYINLSVAQSGFRAKEMATRRLMGSSASAILGKFILESVLLCAVAVFEIGSHSVCFGLTAAVVFWPHVVGGFSV